MHACAVRCAVVAVLVCACAGESVTGPPGAHAPAVSFLRSSPGSVSRLMLMELEAGPPKPITPASHDVTAAYSWSPDGRTVAYVAYGVRGVRLVDRDGANPRLLAGTDTLPQGRFLQWSPDGTHLVVGGGFSLVVLRANGTVFTMLETTTGNEFPTWSPNSRVVAFSSSGKLGLLSIDAGIRYVTLPIYVAHPDWHPDGGSLAFDDGTSIWTSNADGSQPRIVTAQCLAGSTCADKRFQFPKWSPDGRNFAVYVYPGPVAVMRADGTDVRVVPALSSQGLAYAHPNWMMDGRVLFLSDRAGTPSLYLMGSDTTGILRITTGSTRDDVPKRVP